MARCQSRIALVRSGDGRDGLRSPLDYSVFSASSAALLLALYESHTRRLETAG